MVCNNHISISRRFLTATDSGESHVWSTIQLPLPASSGDLFFMCISINLNCIYVPLLLLEQIVCRNCSRNKYPMKYLKDQAAKVCDSCYVELKKRGKIPSFLTKLTNLFPACIMGMI